MKKNPPQSETLAVCRFDGNIVDCAWPNCSPELGVDRNDGWPAEIGEYWNSGRTRVSGHWAS